MITLAAVIVVISAHAVIARTPSTPVGRPKVILISLDGATPRLVEEFLSKGILPANRGLGLLKSRGASALQNITCNPSLTAACHISIGSGATVARTDVAANSFHLVASPFTSNISGFAAPIGGYTIGANGATESGNPKAEPVWVNLKQRGKKVVAATFPGADGIDVRLPGVTNGPLLQSAKIRTVDYTVPFGAFAGLSANGFSLTAADFSPAPSQTITQLSATGKPFYSPVLQKTSPLQQFTVGGVNYTIQVAAFDTTNDGIINYDTLVFFDAALGIQPTSSSLPSTGSAFVSARDGKSQLFYLEGSSNKAGTAFYVSFLAPDLSTVRIARYSANAIPRNAAVLSDVDDINNSVGFWAPQPDFRIPERLSPGFDRFPDLELEAIYEDQVRSFTDYQTRVVLRAIDRNRDADLIMTYIEQPDGSEHQFLTTDSRQASDFRNPNSIGNNRDKAKIARYRTYVQTAYRLANQSVQRIIEAVGTTRNGTPKSNIIVVSDHGFAPFHTAVSFNAFLTSRGFDLTKVRAVTSGPAVNIYINLLGREPNGTVGSAEYIALKQQLVAELKGLVEVNPNYSRGSKQIFEKIYSRPIPGRGDNSLLGLGTNSVIAQDSGDVFATLAEGYNFDGVQTPIVPRLGDSAATASILSVPNFYGAHGYNPDSPNMSAIFYAAGPNIGRKRLRVVRNIDIAPTISKILGVEPDRTVQGVALNLN
ncbi:MAG: alkaline phosphatase family protein [Leptolyngbyaceae cyanobacterium CRU_2_3]|nr:alkaline phosphatase family protein [Leptolyngbyaceae cyanobacterium CRU_2_3]